MHDRALRRPPSATPNGATGGDAVSTAGPTAATAPVLPWSVRLLRPMTLAPFPALMPASATVTITYVLPLAQPPCSFKTAETFTEPAAGKLNQATCGREATDNLSNEDPPSRFQYYDEVFLIDGCTSRKIVSDLRLVVD
ncbi:hypothetical protein HPB50_017652 [Hyalomma asiaticum]|uniref:Uncharacterized protein n=1 Tax=Hyalomma asiaticum TaxID=266040 RepID=A0ACB7RVZ2_HYAAI|nr:hypothetical protein HPB50_017652 [Hyalomma asiaticum]